jgi:glucan phosphoethanolaminetransferase (alkaline phosphatase superfamily)
MSKTRQLMLIVIALAALTALTVLARIWGIAFTDDITMAKLIASYVTGAIMATFGVIVLVDYSGHKMKRLLVVLMILVETLGVMFLLQMWTTFLDWWTFAKTGGSIAVIGGLIAFVMAAIEDFDEDKDLKKKNYLD